MLSTMKTQRKASPELSPEALASAAHCLRTLAHPARIRIVELLLADQLTVGELAGLCNLTPAVASTHLGLMKDRGLLLAERRGREVFYSVNERAVSGIIDCLRARFGSEEGGEP
jgi:DNA-binding transcriptional ArsR family regulator